MQARHFDSVAHAMAFLRSEIPENPFHPMKDGKAYVWARDGDEARLLPSPGASFSSPFLYRGQIARHSPCVPGVFRGLPLVRDFQKLSHLDQAKLFLARVRMEEFLAALPQHPAHAYSRQLKLAIFGEALAQHYELPTDRLDLTQDPDVAAFFATNWRDDEGVWHPVREGQGVIYRSAVSDLRQVLGDAREHMLEWIGKQAWPRPGEQKAWTLCLPLGGDFEGLPVDILTFDHHEDASLHFHEMFARGKTLFPPDVLSELADQVRSSPTVDRNLVGKMIRLEDMSESQFQEALDACAVYLLDHFQVGLVDRGALALSPEQMSLAQAQTDQLKATFLDDVGILAVRQVKPDDIPDTLSHGPRSSNDQPGTAT